MNQERARILEELTEWAEPDFCKFTKALMPGTEQVLGVRLPNLRKIALIQQFIPFINNWSVCDSFCASLKDTKDHPEAMWEFLHPYWNAREEYELRFGIVMLIHYYIQQSRTSQALAILDQIQHEGYYVKTAVAWAISMYYMEAPGQVMPYLQNNHLDSFTVQKTLSKIIESRQSDPATKQTMRRLKKQYQQSNVEQKDTNDK